MAAVQYPISMPTDGIAFKKAVAIVLSDSVDLPNGHCTMVFIGVTGDVQVADEAGNVTLWKALAAGTFLRLTTARVYNTNTTATNLIACY